MIEVVATIVNPITASATIEQSITADANINFTIQVIMPE